MIKRTFYKFLDNDEARAILQKTVFRRARAFLEIHDYRNALTDISFCLRRNVAATNLRSLFREVRLFYLSLKIQAHISLPVPHIRLKINACWLWLMLATEEPGGNLRRKMNTDAQHKTRNNAITIDNVKHNLLNK